MSDAYKVQFENGLREGERRQKAKDADTIESLRSRLTECEAKNSRLVAANKARDEFLRGHRYKRSEMDGYIDLCESQMAGLKARLAEAERDAARYRWLRERMEVGPQMAMSGSTRDAMSVRIGCSFMDSEVSKRRSLNDPDAHENGCKKFDAAIDAYLSRKEQP